MHRDGVRLGGNDIHHLACKRSAMHKIQNHETKGEVDD